MCLTFKEDDTYYLIIFPKGYQIDGVRANHRSGKLKALKHCLNIMEKCWRQEFHLRP